MAGVRVPPRVRNYAIEEAARFGVKAAEVLASGRGTPIASLARSAVIRRLAADGFSRRQIARWVDRHHSTVSHHTGKIQ